MVSEKKYAIHIGNFAEGGYKDESHESEAVFTEQQAEELKDLFEFVLDQFSEHTTCYITKEEQTND